MREVTSFSLLRRRNVPGRSVIKRARGNIHSVSVSYGEETSRDFLSCTKERTLSPFQSPTEKKRPGTPRTAYPLRSPAGFSLLRRRNVPGPKDELLEFLQHYGFSLLRRRNVPGLSTRSLVVRSLKTFQSPTEKKRPGTTRSSSWSISRAFQSPTEKKRPGTSVVMRVFGQNRFQSPTEKKRPGTTARRAGVTEVIRVSVSYGEETSRDQNSAA